MVKINVKEIFFGCFVNLHPEQSVAHKVYGAAERLSDFVDALNFMNFNDIIRELVLFHHQNIILKNYSRKDIWMIFYNESECVFQFVNINIIRKLP